MLMIKINMIIKISTFITKRILLLDNNINNNTNIDNIK